MVTHNSSNAFAVEQTAGEIIIRVRSEPQSVDALVPIAAEPLAGLGLEYRPTLALAQAGTLKTVWIGRRRFTKQSWLVALADALPLATDAAPEDELAQAAAKRAARVAR